MEATGQTVAGASGEVRRIVGQLRRAYEGQAWHGPSLKELLADITEEQARERPVAAAHTIEELARHIAAWIRIGRERLSATSSRAHTEEENWPTSAMSWADILSTLDREHRALLDALQSFPESRLPDRVPAPEPQTYYIMLQGIVQHNLYHAGQIAILKKAVRK